MKVTVIISVLFHLIANTKAKETVIGIDLGTTFSCVGVYLDDHAEVIINDQGNRITPSYVAFTDKGERLIGDAAKNQVTSNPENTVYDAKRLIGRRWDEPSVQQDRKLFPFKVIHKNGKPYIELSVGETRKAFAPEEISSMVLTKMKETAEKFLGKPVHDVVVTVPAYFNDMQRQATKDAGTIAGLNILEIITEPTAAAIAYGFGKDEQEKNILVYDLGGGTFDVTVLTIKNRVFTTLAINGDTHLGGEDFDARVMEHFIKIYEHRIGKELTKKRSLQRLRREVEKVKIALSHQHHTRLEMEIDGEDFSEAITRAKFEDLNKDLFSKTIEILQKVLTDANLEKEDIHDIVLVGGSTRIPKIQQLVKGFFNGKELSHRVNPDEAIAYGATLMAANLSGKMKRGIEVLEVNPLSLGIQVVGGYMNILIPRNTHIPTTRSKVYTTVRDNQPEVDIEVYEGERKMANDNHLLGEFVLKGIPPAPARVPKITVTFEIDKNSILHVTAEDKKKGNKKDIAINYDRNRLPPEEIEKMIRDAEGYNKADKELRNRIDARNAFERHIYQLQERVDEGTSFGRKLSSSERDTITKAIDEEILWLMANRDADSEAYSQHQRDFDDTVLPIVNKYERSDL